MILEKGNALTAMLLNFSKKSSIVSMNDILNDGHLDLLMKCVSKTVGFVAVFLTLITE